STSASARLKTEGPPGSLPAGLLFVLHPRSLKRHEDLDLRRTAIGARIVHAVPGIYALALGNAVSLQVRVQLCVGGADIVAVTLYENVHHLPRWRLTDLHADHGERAGACVWIADAVGHAFLGLLSHHPG